MARNAEASRERILEAAMAEFSAYGIAGARVDRIAAAAGCNKNLIYIYFESKDNLFDAVLRKHLARVYEENAFTPDDLPGYAARVFEFTRHNPDLMRLMAWHSLEHRGEVLPERAATQAKKLETLREAQRAGAIGNAFAPGFLMAAVMTLATAYSATNPFGPSHDPEGAANPDEARDAIVKAIELLAKPSS